jgi:hypothetical protein
MADEFGEAYAAVISRDLVLGELGDLTADQCIKAGEDLRKVWVAICKAQSVSQDRWNGVNKNTKK